MIHQNEHILKTIRPLFPIRALIKSLQMPSLDKSVKAGLTRIFLSLFMNSEKLFFIKKPKTQRVIGESHFPCSWTPTFITTDQLREIKEIISIHFDENDAIEDLSYEYLRLLSYLLNSDFLLGPVRDRDEWLYELSSAYTLLQKAFKYCVKQISISIDSRDLGIRKRTTTSSLSQAHDESDDPPVIARGKSAITEEQLTEARKLLNDL